MGRARDAVHVQHASVSWRLATWAFVAAIVVWTVGFRAEGVLAESTSAAVIDCDEDCEEAGTWAAGPSGIDVDAGTAVGTIREVSPGGDVIKVDFAGEPRSIEVTSWRALPALARGDPLDPARYAQAGQPILVHFAHDDGLILSGARVHVNWWQSRDLVMYTEELFRPDGPDALFVASVVEAEADRIRLVVNGQTIDLNAYMGDDWNGTSVNASATNLHMITPPVGWPTYEPEQMQRGTRVLVYAQDDFRAEWNPRPAAVNGTEAACVTGDRPCEWTARKILVPPPGPLVRPWWEQPDYVWTKRLGNVTTSLVGTLVGFDEQGNIVVAADGRLIRVQGGLSADIGARVRITGNGRAHEMLQQARVEVAMTDGDQTVAPSPIAGAPMESELRITLETDQAMPVPPSLTRSVDGATWEVPVDTVSVRTLIDNSTIAPTALTLQLLLPAASYLEPVAEGDRLANTITARVEAGDPLPAWTLRIMDRPSEGMQVDVPLVATLLTTDGGWAASDALKITLDGSDFAFADAGRHPSGVVLVDFLFAGPPDAWALRRDHTTVTISAHPSGYAVGRFNYAEFDWTDEDLADFDIPSVELRVWESSRFGHTQLYNRPSIQQDEMWWRRGLSLKQFVEEVITPKSVFFDFVSLGDISLEFELTDHDELSRLPRGWGVGMSYQVQLGLGSPTPFQPLDSYLARAVGEPCRQAEVGQVFQAQQLLLEGDVCLGQLSPLGVWQTLVYMTEDPVIDGWVLPGPREVTAWLVEKDPLNADIYLQALADAGGTYLEAQAHAGP